jgi:hypothetical protein
VLGKLAGFFDKGKEIPLNKEEVTLRREPNQHFGYRIVEDWQDDEITYYSAVDMREFPIAFPGSDTVISGETKESVRSRMWNAYPLAEEME